MECRIHGVCFRLFVVWGDTGSAPLLGDQSILRETVVAKCGRYALGPYYTVDSPKQPRPSLGLGIVRFKFRV